MTKEWMTEEELRQKAEGRRMMAEGMTASERGETWTRERRNKFSALSKALKKMGDEIREEGGDIEAYVERFAPLIIKGRIEIDGNARIFSRKVLGEVAKEKLNLSKCKEALAEALCYSSYRGLKAKTLDLGLDPFIVKGILKEQRNDY